MPESMAAQSSQKEVPPSARLSTAEETARVFKADRYHKGFQGVNASSERKKFSGREKIRYCIPREILRIVLNSCGPKRSLVSEY